MSLSKKSTVINLLVFLHIYNASDYGYAVGGENRSCIENNNLSNYGCIANNWLNNSSYYIEWFLSSNSSSAADVFEVLHSRGEVDSELTLPNYNAVRPTLYLSKSVKIVNGTGEKDSPYILECSNCVE